VSSRAGFQVPPEQRFDIPQLTGDEIKNWVSALRGVPPNPSELAIIIDRSGGNPLYLRFYALGGDPTTDLSLRELEIRALQSLAPRSREITTYLALSSRPFSLGDLHALVGAEEGPEEVAGNLAAASGLLKQARGRVQLVHEHLRATVQAQLEQTPTRLAFFATRLGSYFEHLERYMAAFHVYFEAGELRHADRLLDRAANEAAIMGGGASAIAIFRRQAELGYEAGQHDKEVHALLNLAFALNQTGARDDAAHALGKARSIAQKHNLESQLLRVNEMEIILDVRSVQRTERIREFEALREKYSSTGDSFNGARLGTLVAAEYITGGDFEDAARISRDVLEAFTNVGDEYGIRVARVNLATALSGIVGREHEAAALAQDLQKELDPEDYPRERAVLCNLLTRYYRELGNTARASEFALEAIRIGEQLGDKRLIAINRTNLGNVRRDEGGPDQALLEYRSAEQAALAAGDRESESAANELIASVLNEQEHYREALNHAEHASALARQVNNQLLIARAEEERAIALEGQREIGPAIDAYAEAAIAIAEVRPGGSSFVSLISKALHLSVTSNRIDLKIRFLQKVFSSKTTPAGDAISSLQVLYTALPKMAEIINVDRLLAIITLSMSDLLGDVPVVVERRIVLQAIEALLKSSAGPSNDGTLMSVAAVLLAHSLNCLTLADLVDLAERVTRSSKRIYFKPMPDGAAHWTVRLDIANGVIVSVVQLDDSPRTAVIAAIVTLLLFTLDDFMRERLLDVESLPRQEAIINIVSRKDIEAQIDPSLLNLGDMPKGFAVAESTDVTLNDQPPILAICAGDFPKPWQPNTYALSDIHLLLAELLRVLVAHLVGKSIEHEVLFPKIISIIHEIGYKGPAEHLHSREDTTAEMADGA
jgi:tetratricopeptide (TPR) repeat protein